MKTRYVFLLLAVTLFAISCDKFEKASRNPYAMESSQAKAESYVQPILFKTQSNLLSVFRSTTAMLMHMKVVMVLL